MYEIFSIVSHEIIFLWTLIISNAQLLPKWIIKNIHFNTFSAVKNKKEYIFLQGILRYLLGTSAHHWPLLTSGVRSEVNTNLATQNDSVKHFIIMRIKVAIFPLRAHAWCGLHALLMTSRFALEGFMDL